MLALGGAFSIDHRVLSGERPGRRCSTPARCRRGAATSRSPSGLKPMDHDPPGACGNAGLSGSGRVGSATAQIWALELSPVTASSRPLGLNATEWVIDGKPVSTGPPRPGTPGRPHSTRCTTWSSRRWPVAARRRGTTTCAPDPNVREAFAGRPSTRPDDPEQRDRPVVRRCRQLVALGREPGHVHRRAVTRLQRGRKFRAHPHRRCSTPAPARHRWPPPVAALSGGTSPR